MALLIILTSVTQLQADNARTQNFIVSSPHSAEEIAIQAERYRQQIAVEWLGEELPDWIVPCNITVRFQDQLEGFASYSRKGNTTVGNEIIVKGPIDKILRSVLPHEITHLVLAHKRLPADIEEGICILNEHPLEQNVLGTYRTAYETTVKLLESSTKRQLVEENTDGQDR